MKRLSTTYPVKRIAAVLSVSRSGYYKQTGTGVRAVENEKLTRDIKRVFSEHRQRYGSPRIWLQLQAEGVACGKNRVAGLMRTANLHALCSARKKPRTTDSSHNGPIAPNILKTMMFTAPNQAWAMDITYIQCGSGWAYLAAVLDMYLHKIVGWHLADHMESNLIETALRMAHLRQGQPKEVVVHSDRGSQYASKSFIELTELLKATRSMSAKGNCYDNATMESFFGVLKREELNRWYFADLQAVRHHVFDYIETYYNRERIHTALGMSPLAFESNRTHAGNRDEFSEAWVAPRVGNKKAGEQAPQPRPKVATSGYPSESCSPAELSSVFPDQQHLRQSNIEINNKKEYHITR